MYNDYVEICIQTSILWQKKKKKQMKETSAFKAEGGYICKSVLVEGGTTGTHSFEEMIPTGSSSDSSGV